MNFHIFIKELIFHLYGYMCCNLAESVGTWKLGELIVRYSQKKEWISFVFYCFENPSNAHNFGTTGPIQVGFSAKCTSPNEHINQIENWKCHIFDFRLISLDRITYNDRYHSTNYVDCFLIQPITTFQVPGKKKKERMV